MPWAAVKKATVLIPSGPAHDLDRKHLHIVLTDPTAATNEVLLVSVCSIPQTNIYDGSCSLFPGEHEFIVNHSYVAYKFCRIVSAPHLEAKVADGTYIAKAVLDDKKFAYVIEGLRESPHVAPKFRRFFESTQ